MVMVETYVKNSFPCVICTFPRLSKHESDGINTVWQWEIDDEILLSGESLSVENLQVVAGTLDVTVMPCLDCFFSQLENLLFCGEAIHRRTAQVYFQIDSSG